MSRHGDGSITPRCVVATPTRPGADEVGTASPGYARPSHPRRRVSRPDQTSPSHPRRGCPGPIKPARHTRAGGCPVRLLRDDIWMPAFAGMTGIECGMTLTAARRTYIVYRQLGSRDRIGLSCVLTAEVEATTSSPGHSGSSHRAGGCPGPVKPARHTRAGGCPVLLLRDDSWMPAFAGMTGIGYAMTLTAVQKSDIHR